MPEDEPSVPAKPHNADPAVPIDPASVITNPLILDVYRKMERASRDHGPLLFKELGYIGTTEITMRDGRIIPITIDLRQGTGKTFIG